MAKRGTDHTWKLIKYKGNAAIYAKCRCKYYYNCGRKDSKNPINSGSEKGIVCPQCKNIIITEAITI